VQTAFHLVYLKESRQSEWVSAGIIIDAWADHTNNVCRVPLTDQEQAARMLQSPEENWTVLDFKLIHTFGKLVTVHCVPYSNHYTIFLDNWEEAREQLPEARKGQFKQGAAKKYGRGQREHIPKKIYSPLPHPTRAKKATETIQELNQATVEVASQLRLPTPPPALQQPIMDNSTTGGDYKCVSPIQVKC
jgi:hypothetical protein